MTSGAEESGPIAAMIDSSATERARPSVPGSDGTRASDLPLPLHVGACATAATEATGRCPSWASGPPAGDATAGRRTKDVDGPFDDADDQPLVGPEGALEGGEGIDGGADPAAAAIPYPTFAVADGRSTPLWKEFLFFAGPGFFVCMAYIDPGNLASDINQGTQAGYRLIWVTFWCTALGWVLQLASARLGLASGRDLASTMRHEFPVAPRFLLYVVSECGVIACDMIEVIGGAVALWVLSDGRCPLWAGVIITAAAGFVLLVLERVGMRALEATLATLVALLGGTFIYLFFETDVNYGQAFLGVVWPRMRSSEIQLATGAIGAIIMPHNLYLHSALIRKRKARMAWVAANDGPSTSGDGKASPLPGPSAATAAAATTPPAAPAAAPSRRSAFLASVPFLGALIERRRASGSRPRAGKPSGTVVPRAAVPALERALNFVALESAIALFISLIVNFTVISVSSGAFAAKVEADPGFSVGLLNFGEELQKIFGGVVEKLWGIGLLASAFASTVTSTYAGQVMLGGFLGRPISAWWRTFAVRMVTLGPTMGIAFALGKVDGASFDSLTNWLNVVQSLVLPFVIVPLASFVTKDRIVGALRTSLALTAWLVLLTAFLVGMNIYLFVDLAISSIPDRAWAQALFWIAFTAYMTFLAYLTAGARRAARWYRLAGNVVRRRRGLPELLIPGPIERGWMIESERLAAEAAEADAARLVAKAASDNAAAVMGDDASPVACQPGRLAVELAALPSPAQVQ